jgi:hypothetical protein
MLCLPNKQGTEWNNAVIFKRHILATYPTVNSSKLPPSHTLMVEAKMQHQKSKKNVAKIFHNIVMSQLGNNDIKSESHESQGAKIDPILRLYPGAFFMCNTNDALKFGRGNGTLWHCIKVRMKQNA